MRKILFRIRIPEELRLSPGQCARIALYTIVIAAASVLIHEAAHVVAALTLGVPFDELRFGFLGINPSVTLPEWFTGTPRTVVHYAGGLTAGAGLLFYDLLYWVRRYRRSPYVFGWFLGAVTSVFAAMQFATGYLEGRYHGAYIIGVMSFFSLTDLLMYGWAISAVSFHSALCPWRRMRKTQ
ncbi:MAG: hypothetical protein R6V59_00905 [Dehalococcoidia bacterium]